MTKRLLFLAMLLLSLPAYARQALSGYCEQGGNTVVVNGVVSTTKVQKSFPSCTVTVYLTGTVTLATLYSDNAGTPLSNPFTAASDGSWTFLADDGVYDTRFSGGGITSPFTRSGLSLLSGNNGKQYPGANLGVALLACLTALPSTGGTCDMTAFTGAQVIAINPVGGQADKPFTILFGYATIADSSCWIMPNDGTSLPKQGSRRILGVGIDAATIPAGKTPTSGTIINNSCNSGVAKLDSRGAGVLEMHGVTWMDSSGSSLPFAFFTNTMPKISDNQFYGSKNGVLNDQDAIILGGTGTVSDGSSTAPFQGYGGYIQHNHFNHIRRAVYGRTYVNGFPVTENTVWEQAGSNLAGGAAIEFVDSSGVNSNAGNLIERNLIEVINYVYGVKFSANGVWNSVKANGCFDGDLGVVFVACTRFEGNSKFNYVEEGPQNDAFSGISEDAGSLGTNEYHTSHQSKTSVIPQPYNFTSTITSTKTTVNAKNFISTLTLNNDAYWWGISTAGSSSFILWTDPLGGTSEAMVSFKRYDANQRGVFINAATNGFFECLVDCRFRAGAGANGWIGTNTTPDIILVGDSLLKFNQHAIFKTDNTFDIGANGATRPRTLYLGTSLCIAAGTCFTGQSGTGGTVVMQQSPTINAPNIVGVATNSSAAAGSVGELVTNSVSGVNLTTVVTSTVSSVTLTAGDWDVSSTCYFIATVGATYLRISNFTTAATVLITSDGSTALLQLASGTLGSSIFSTGTIRASLAAPTTYYTNVDSSFGAGTIVANCTTRARRIR